MNFLIIWIITYILSIIMKIGNMFKIYQDVANLGYKITNKNLGELNNKSISKNSINDWLMFVPIINMIYNIYEAYSYANNKDIIIQQLKMNGLLERMTVVEFDSYRKKPTALNAFILNIQTEEVIEKQEEIEKLEHKLEKYQLKEKERKDLLKFINKVYGDNPDLMNELKNTSEYSWLFKEKSDKTEEAGESLNEETDVEKEEMVKIKKKVKRYKK